MRQQKSAQPTESDPLAAVAHAVPADQPNRVHEVAARLLGAYEVIGGHAHLAGCTLDDVPVVRVSDRGDQHQSPTIDLIFGQANPQGRRVDEQLHQDLGLANLCPSRPPPSVPPQETTRLVDTARQAAGLPEGDQDLTKEITVIWCKYARGKVQFTIGDAIAQQAFAGWARQLEAPKYQCPVTGVESYRVAATSDGRVIAADELATCDISGQRLPRRELVKCVATHQHVAMDLAVRCAVSQQHVLKSELMACPVCRQQVSPLAITGGRCQGCRSLTTVRLDDPRLVQVLAMFPQLANWRWLRLAETTVAYILTASGLMDRRLIVVDKATGRLLHAAKRSRISTAWTALDEAELRGSL